MEPGSILPKINPLTGKPFEIQLDDGKLVNELDARSFDVLRKAGTEVAFTGEYYESETIGVYECKACGAELFRSETKFHSGCGWPSFYAPSDKDAVILLEDRSLAPKCGSHLGHVFEGEGYAVPTDQRWCINSVALVLKPNS
jgi:peptide-methionine (R)-S-oxide reductase